MTNKERREIKKLVRMMREAGVKYRASKPVIELLEGGADEIERLAAFARSDAEPSGPPRNEISKIIAVGISENQHPITIADAILSAFPALAQSNAELETYGDQLRRVMKRQAMQSDAEPVKAFAKAVLHGDDEHKAWLMEAAEAFIAGRPLPAPRGKGVAQSDVERNIKELESGG